MSQDQGEGIRPEDSPEKGWKPEDDVELVPPDLGQPDKEAQIARAKIQARRIEMREFVRKAPLKKVRSLRKTLS